MYRKKTLVRALSIAFGATALTLSISSTALAQSNASGNIFGTVGQQAGTTVVLNNVDTGLKRVITPDATGKFTATALPIGHYKVDVVRGGAVVTSTEVDVLVGQGVEAAFVATPAAGIQTVTVSGRASKIDVSSTNNGATFTAKELANLPIPQTVDAIIQLAPNTTRADPRYAAGASFGGGGASENSYYINGFPVTNPLTQLGASELPFGAIAQAQILTGGFGAEFGRSVGGVVNITTKSGTNKWEAGGMVSVEPNSLRAKAKDVYYANTGDQTNAATDGTLYSRNRQNTENVTKYGGYVGGPIIKDQLFMFVAAEQTRDKQGFVSGTSDSTSNDLNGWTDNKNTTTRYMAKFDWNITDNHRLEFTAIGDRPVTEQAVSDFDYTTFAHTGMVSGRSKYVSIANVTPTTGAKTNILKYTGNITDALTVTALYGSNKTDHYQDLFGYDPNLAQIIASPSARAPGLSYPNPQSFGDANGRLSSPRSYDKVTSQRFDLEYKVGQHTLRGGIDNNKLSSFGAGEFQAGGSSWNYGTVGLNDDGTPVDPFTPIKLNGYLANVGAGGGLGTQGFFVSHRFFNDVTAAFSNQSAQYVEDRYQMTKDLLVTFGIRDEQYENKNGDGQTFLKVKNQINPRLSAAWDVNGDASLKVFGSAGRYSIQIPTHVAIRGASRSTLTREYFTYTGVDANGVPTGLNQITPVTSVDNEFGQAKLYQTVAAQDIRPSFQDEITLGFERAFSPSLNFGVKGTYRKLKSTIDDFCDQRPFDTYAAAHGIDESNYGGFNCASINPGETNKFLVDYAGTGQNLTPVTLTAADMGFDKAKRTYAALDFFFEHPLRGGWYGKLNYTLARSQGNTEGQTLSAVAQTDVAATETWDHREIMEYANGLLPNDRKHQIKAFGFYQVLPEVTVGGNLLIASGQPITCLGNYPVALQANDPGFPDYGSAYHYCFGPSGANLPSPNGAAGRLPWDIRLDMDVVYKPEVMKGVAFKFDVFNVFNKQTLQQIDQQYNTSAGSISPTYYTPGARVGYTAPRSMKLTMEYNHKF
jgi:hypothetical protein